MKKILVIILFLVNVSNVFASNFIMGVAAGSAVRENLDSQKQIIEVKAALMNEEVCIQQNESLKSTFSDLKLAVRDDVAETLAKRIVNKCETAKKYLKEYRDESRNVALKTIFIIIMIFLIIGIIVVFINKYIWKNTKIN